MLLSGRGEHDPIRQQRISLFWKQTRSCKRFKLTKRHDLKNRIHICVLHQRPQHLRRFMPRFQHARPSLRFQNMPCPMAVVSVQVDNSGDKTTLQSAPGRCIEPYDFLSGFS